MADVKELPKLPYSYDALEPYIDAKTMEVCAVCTVLAAGSTSNSARRGSKGSTALLRASQLLHCPSLSGAAPAAMCLLLPSSAEQQIRCRERLICQRSYGMWKAAWPCIPSVMMLAKACLPCRSTTQCITRLMSPS